MKKDGGMAFPAPFLGQDADGKPVAHTGMSLRDYFAAAALQGGLCFHQEDGCWRDAEEAAQLAYKHADAMLAERDK